MVTAAVMAAVGVIFGAKVLLATSKIITSNAGGGAPALAGDVDPTKLRGEGDGRVNILLLGVGGPGHDGGTLSDTIMVVSLDPRTKEVAMLGIPRDLYVPVPGGGSAKINSAHASGESKRYRGGGPALAKKTVENVLGVRMHYYARIDFSGFKKGVDSVGGVDVQVEEDLSDSKYPCDRNPARECGFNLAAGPRHLNGATALKYARCRTGTCGGDFGRAARQQQVLLALRDKALSLSTLTNPAKIAALIDVVGSSAQTDLQLAEIKKLAEIAKEIDKNKVVTKVLDTSPDGLLEFGDIPGAGSIVVPKAGVGDFSEIKRAVQAIFVDNYLKEEAASIEVHNGTTRDGLATKVGKVLQGYNYNVVRMVTADRQNYAGTVIYDYTGGQKPYTVKYLETRFGAKAQKFPGSGNQADIKVVVGADYRE
ncbi:LCP family protein [Candidatus Parcubacteria bacterium]|nr:LCP family protein [Candidatus Parcubacteria bacterium]